MPILKPYNNQKNIQPITFGCFVVIAMTLSVFCTPVFAGTFNISLSITTHLIPKHLNVEVEVINKGSSTAYGANVLITTYNKSFTHGKTPDILAGDSFTFSFIIPHERLPLGSYPVVAVCRFKDSHAYPFTALHASTFVVDAKCAQLITADLNAVSITKNASVPIRLQNHEKTPLTATMQLILPDEFAAIKEYSITLPPQSTEQMILDITNIHALAGAAYPFFCIIEYDIHECHHTLIANNTLRVGKISTDNLFYTIRWYLLSGFAIILFGIILIGAIGTVRTKKAD
jgi:hypothetical protein